MKFEIDATGWQILVLLQRNARMSYAELGKAVGLTAPAVAERIRKMEEANIISGYHAHLNPDALGLSLMAMVNIQNPKIHAERLLELARSAPEVLSCDEVTGQDNYIMQVVATTRGHLRDVLQRFLDYGMTTSYIVLAQHVGFKPISAETINYDHDK